MKVGFISLGCNKNLVDTEKTISIFKENNYEIVNNPKKADIIVINTCGFIQPAKEEAINTILEMAEYKKQRCRYLIVMGCLVERYKQELEKEIPEVDLFIKYSEYKTLWSKVQELIKKREGDIMSEDKDELLKQQNEEIQKLKKELKLQSPIHANILFLLRSSFRLLPSSLLGKIYNTFLRKKVHK